MMFGDEEDLKQVFTAFYTTKRGQGGTGLGLAIVHRLVTEALQGKIEMVSSLGKGTSVTVCFPKRLKVRKA
jgi:signal transduction histidine kinase